MIKYRVYVKKAKENVSTSYSERMVNSTTYYVSNKINVDRRHHYYLLTINGTPTEYTILQYDQNGDRITPNRILSDINNSDSIYDKIYIPNENVKSIELRINKSAFQDTANKLLFLKSQSPILIHDNCSPDPSYHLSDITLHLEDSAAGYLEFGINPKHIYYKNKINLWTDTFYVVRSYSDGSEKIIWDGRAITEDIVVGTKVYHCEGALSYLNDSRVVANDGHAANTTVYDFIQDRIINEQTDNSITHNVMDRSFYGKKERDNNTGNLKPIEWATIYVDQGVKYDWETHYESSYKWLANIKEAFGGHFKIRYRSYDSPIDDIICRCFTFLKNLDDGVLVSEWSNIENSTKIKKGEHIRNTTSGTMFFYEVIKDFVKNKQKLLKLEKSGYIKKMDSDEDFEIKDGEVYYKYNNNRFNSINASFGLNVFDAKKASEIKDFATIIIPRGSEIQTNDGRSINISLSTSLTANNKTYTPVQAGPYIEDLSLIKKYGYVCAVVDFEDADTPQKLKNMARDWFKNLKNEIIKQNIEISLSNFSSNVIPPKSGDPLTDTEYVDIWTEVRAEIPELEMSKEEKYYVSSLNIPLDDPINTTITLMNKANLISENKISAGDIKGASKGIIDTSS